MFYSLIGALRVVSRTTGTDEATRLGLARVNFAMYIDGYNVDGVQGDLSTGPGARFRPMHWH